MQILEKLHIKSKLFEWRHPTFAKDGSGILLPRKTRKILQQPGAEEVESCSLRSKLHVIWYLLKNTSSQLIFRHAHNESTTQLGRRWRMYTFSNFSVAGDVSLVQVWWGAWILWFPKAPAFRQRIQVYRALSCWLLYSRYHYTLAITFSKHQFHMILERIPTVNQEKSTISVYIHNLVANHANKFFVVPKANCTTAHVPWRATKSASNSAFPLLSFVEKVVF